MICYYNRFSALKLRGGLVFTRTCASFSHTTMSNEAEVRAPQIDPKGTCLFLLARRAVHDMPAS